MGAIETVDLFFELINDDDREKAVELFAENAILGVSVPGSDERTNLRGRDKVGGWFVRAGDGFRMYTNDSRDMGASYVADVTVIRPGIQPMHEPSRFASPGAEMPTGSSAPPHTRSKPSTRERTPSAHAGTLPAISPSRVATVFCSRQSPVLASKRAALIFVPPMSMPMMCTV